MYWLGTGLWKRPTTLNARLYHLQQPFSKDQDNYSYFDSRHREWPDQVSDSSNKFPDQARVYSGIVKLYQMFSLCQRFNEISGHTW